MRYLQYYKEYRGRRDSGINESEIIPMLKKCVVLVTNRGLKTPDTEIIHFSSEYLSRRDDLVQMFPGMLYNIMAFIFSLLIRYNELNAVYRCEVDCGVFQIPQTPCWA